MLKSKNSVLQTCTSSLRVNNKITSQAFDDWWSVVFTELTLNISDIIMSAGVKCIIQRASCWEKIIFNGRGPIFASCVSLEDETVAERPSMWPYDDTRRFLLLLLLQPYLFSSVHRGRHSVPPTLRAGGVRLRLPPSKLRPSGGCSLWTRRPDGRSGEDGTVRRGEERKCHSSDGERWRNPEERSGGGRRQQDVWNHRDLYRL